MRTGLGMLAGDGPRRGLARVTLLGIGAASIAVLLFGSTSLGSPSTLSAQPSPTETEPPGPTGPVIQLLNPSAGLDPVLVDPREPADSPNISDKFDGTDGDYHVVAVTPDTPPNSIVEAYWQAGTANEVTIGTLQPASGAEDVWELFWDIPLSLSEGEGILRVRLYEQTFGGLEEVALDEVEATLQHEGEPMSDPEPAEETVELTWPTQNGPLGFFKPKTGPWRTVIEGTASQFASRVDLAYSVAPLSEDPAWKFCGSAAGINAQGGVTAAGTNGGRIFRRVCTLAGTDVPSQVTAVGVLALEPDTPTHSGVFTNDSSDVHHVQTYLQDPTDMTITLTPIPPATPTASWPTGKRRVAGSDCLEFDALVTDNLSRPVQGANLDFHLIAPGDQVGFGDEASGSDGSSVDRPPAPQTGHNNEMAWDCDAPGDRFGQQGDHNVPAAPDIKHIQSTAGTGMDGPASAQFFFGKFRFHVFSEEVGFSDIEAWIDEDPVLSEDPEAERAVGDDAFGSSEPSATVEAQWFPQALTLSFDPAGASGMPGECVPLTIRARAGSRVVAGIDLDLHATGPNDDLDFCDPGDASPKSAPDHPDAKHSAEDPEESSHDGPSPRVQHTEGETNDAGNFVIGLTSPVNGDTTIEAWVDGEPGQDNDVFNSGEVRTTATINWLSSLADAELSFINPSSYGTATGGAGNGTRVGNARDADTLYHVVVRVDALAPGVELFLGQDVITFRKLGDMTQIGTSDLWEFFWNVDATDDTSPTLRAQIIGTDRREDIVINVNTAGNPTTRAYETAEIVSPIDGTLVSFNNQATEIRGVASAGAEGIELYYTKAPAKDTPQGVDWILCGYVDLSGTTGQPQDFKGSCKLQASDQAALVTGLAAITFDCSPIMINDGCNGNPAPPVPEPRQPGEKESGDAHRVYGFEGFPVLQIEPPESESGVDSCQAVTVSLTDQTGQPLVDENLDLHLQGPGNGVSFCDAEGVSPNRAPDQGAHSGAEEDEGIDPNTTPPTHHTEGETRSNGEFVVGITSNAAGDSNLTVWVDDNDDDILSEGEQSDTAVKHWTKPGGGNGGRCTKVGTSGNDVLRGTRGRDVLCGRRGNDRLLGRGGNDLLLGAGGNDRLFGGPGRDRLSGHRGRDLLNGGPGRDRLNGGNGRDRLLGGARRDACFGGRGRDSFRRCERRRR